MKFCVDCRHYQKFDRPVLTGRDACFPASGPVDRCNAKPTTDEVDLVTGKPLVVFVYEPRYNRSEENKCGKMGNWFEPIVFGGAKV